MDNNKEKYQLRFLVLPDYIYQDNSLGAVAIKVYSFIHSYTGEDFYFSNDSLAKMFNCSPDAVKDAVKKLIDGNYIIADYKIKSGGGKLRFIQDCFNKENFRQGVYSQSESADSHRENGSEVPNKDNNEKAITKRKEKIEKKESYPLSAITQEDVEEIAAKYHCTPAFVLLQKEKMTNWAEAKNKHYSNWKSALRNWVISSMEKSIEGRMQNNVRPTIDARGLSKRV